MKIGQKVIVERVPSGDYSVRYYSPTMGDIVLIQGAASTAIILMKAVFSGEAYAPYNDAPAQDHPPR